MLPSAGRVYISQNITDEDNPNAVVHVGPAYAENGAEEEGASEQRAIMSTAGNGGGDDDVNALYPVRLDEIPSTMRRALAMTGMLTLVTSPQNPSKLRLNATFAALLATGPGFGFGMYLVFYYIFNDQLVAGITSGAMSASFLAFCFIGYTVAKSPVFRALLLNPASKKKMTKEFNNLFFGNSFLWLALLTPLAYYYCYFPELKSGDFFGDATTPIVWVCIITFPTGAWSSSMAGWGDILPVPCAERTTAMIEEYAGRLREILLAKNVAPDERLARIAKEQTRVEAWAKVLHASMSTISGVYFAATLLLIVITLGVAAVAKSGNIGFAVFGVATLLFLGRYLWAQTLQSRTFKKVKVQLLNDADLIPAINQAFLGKVNFDLWWESHEISASTMCGIKMTTRRVFKALVGLGSVVFVVAGLLIRQAMGTGGLMRA